MEKMRNQPEKRVPRRPMTRKSGVTNRQKSLTPAAARPSDYQGFVDMIQSHAIGGWVADRLDLTRHLTVKAFADGSLIGTAIGKHYRADLERSGIGDGRFGFKIDISSSHRLDSLIVIADDAVHPYRLPIICQSTAGQEPASSEGADQEPHRPALDPPTVMGRETKSSPKSAKTPVFRGFVDAISYQFIAGWAVDCQDPTRRPPVRALANNQLVGSTICDLYREDLEETGIGDGRYGFRIDLATKVLESSFPLDRLVVIVDDATEPYRLPFTQSATDSLNAPPLTKPDKGLAEQRCDADIFDNADVAIPQSSEQVLQEILGQFRTALTQQIEKQSSSLPEIKAIASHTANPKDPRLIAPERLHLEARVIYRQILYKLKVAI